MWCKKKSGILVDIYHCESGRKITKLKDSTCSTEILCKETIIKGFYIETKVIRRNLN